MEIEKGENKRKEEKMRKQKKKEEKVEVNENLEEISKDEKKPRKKKKVGKSRYFCFITYGSEKELQTTIAKHSSSIRAFAYIFHGEDENVPHWHLLVRTYSTWTENQILKWFDWLKLKSNTNTLVEIMDDTIAMGEYLTHTDYKSVMAGKHPYRREDIKDFGLFDIVDKRDSYDETYEIVQNVIAGMGERELIRRYGKNYLFHRNAFQEAADTIYHQQTRFNRMEIKAEEYQSLRMMEIDEGVDLGALFDEN